MKKFFLLALTFLLSFGLFSCCEADVREIPTVYFSSDNSNVFPVLYFESNVGSYEYDTSTYILKDGLAVLTEDHYRTFSKTYPESALDKFGGITASRDKYGQLLFYHSESDGEIFIFERFFSNDAVKEYFLKKGDNEAVIPYSSGEYYAEFLKFDGIYYLFLFSRTSPELANYDIFKYYMFDSNLSNLGQGIVDFSKAGIKSVNFLDKTVAIRNNRMIFGIYHDGEYGYLVHDMENSQTYTVKTSFAVGSVLSAEDGFYSLGKNEHGLILCSPDQSGLPQSAKNIVFPEDIYSKDAEVSLDKILYIRDGKVYFSFTQGNKAYFAAADKSSAEICGYWVFDCSKADALLMDVKYVALNGDKYFDLWQGTEN
ncbi:MAG: hypothetical protein IKM29_05930 [Clostridia bacterium]|nr:hypothetical protein [Clostridia bacterium]